MDLNIYNFSYSLPLLQIILVISLKLLVGKEFAFENLKRVFLESSLDLQLTSFSFTILHYIAAVNGKIKSVDSVFLNSFVFNLLICFIVLLIISAISNGCTSKYNETGKSRYILIGGLIANGIALFNIYYVINLIILP